MTARHHTERGFDRLVNFSDAVVAIAITLLVMPLLDLELGDPPLGAWQVLVRNQNAFWSFLVTFLLVAVYWVIHHRIFENLADYDGLLIWVNMLWLLLIALLPFVSYALQTTGLAHGTGAVYFGDLAAQSILLSVMSHHAARHPELLAREAEPSDLGGSRGWIISAYAAFLALLSLYFPTAAGYASSGLIVLSFFTGRKLRSRTAASQVSA